MAGEDMIFHLPFRVTEWEEESLIYFDRNFKEIELMLSNLQMYMKKIGKGAISTVIENAPSWDEARGFFDEDGKLKEYESILNEANQYVHDFYGQKVHYGDTALGNPDKGALWVDTSQSPAVWKQWDGTKWEKITRTGLDEMAGKIVSTQITDKSIDTPHLKANIIDAEHLKANIIETSHISTAGLDAGIITAGLIDVSKGIILRTKASASGARMEIDTNGLRSYDTAGTKNIEITKDGNILMNAGSISWANVNPPTAGQVGARADSWLPTESQVVGSKLTKITSTGVYTGTVEATQITGGTLTAINELQIGDRNNVDKRIRMYTSSGYSAYIRAFEDGGYPNMYLSADKTYIDKLFIGIPGSGSASEAVTKKWLQDNPQVAVFG